MHTLDSKCLRFYEEFISVNDDARCQFHYTRLGEIKEGLQTDNTASLEKYPIMQL